MGSIGPTPQTVTHWHTHTHNVLTDMPAQLFTTVRPAGIDPTAHSVKQKTPPSVYTNLNAVCCCCLFLMRFNARLCPFLHQRRAHSSRWVWRRRDGNRRSLSNAHNCTTAWTTRVSRVWAPTGPEVEFTAAKDTTCSTRYRELATSQQHTFT